MHNLDLNNLIECKSSEQVDLIDVIWTEHKGKIIAVLK